MSPTKVRRAGCGSVDIEGTTYEVPGPVFPDGSPNISRDEALRFLALFGYAVRFASPGNRASTETDSAVLNFTKGFLTGAVKGAS